VHRSIHRCKVYGETQYKSCRDLIYPLIVNPPEQGKEYEETTPGEVIFVWTIVLDVSVKRTGECGIFS
jgi:hypothetical protein